MTPTIQQRRYYSPKEISAITGLSMATISRRIKDGTIPAVRIGRRLLIPASWDPFQKQI
ncbi:MAG: DNA-binding protein [Sulfobacillus acidophilus]|uniref:DNA-binding protein n=1 Tax=Sulfobacillus acidophilus TaxID=53633 RepID=A0A2T2WMB8_9FIRM|nr:MAG: DNA-binding protein [Sulfobacillus acidophilus]